MRPISGINSPIGLRPYRAAARNAARTFYLSRLWFCRFSWFAVSCHSARVTASDTTISSTLLDWYDVHARALPWRNPPGEPLPNDPAWPYRVWLSEVMLQQTTVAAVKPYFAKFTETWPSVEALAKANEADVMAAWAGLGYYSRARNIVKCAKEVAERGGFPDTEAELRELPGLGAYTAAAIAAIAFGKRAVVVDANVERVVSRVCKITEPLPASHKTIRRHAEAMTPADRAGDFAQAMMDLGLRHLHHEGTQMSALPRLASCVRRAKPVNRSVYRSNHQRRPSPSGSGRRSGSSGTMTACSKCGW